MVNNDVREINLTFFSVLGVLLFISLVSGCASNTVSERTTSSSNVIKDSSLDKASTVAKKPSPSVQQKKITPPEIKTSQNPGKVVKKVPALRARWVQRSQGGAWENNRSHQLTGDFSKNPQTRAFIEMMSVKHGFDRRYLNYVFSQTQATPFLRRMAFRDAYPVKKTRKSRKGNWTRYRNLFLTEKTIQQGVQFWRRNRVALQQAEQRYGVPQEYILGIIGVETRYGGNVGKNRAIDALATMGFNNARRGTYFQKELESYLLMTRRAGLNPLQPMASYAGALGLCQFMPSNIKRYGVDHDRSGACNLWTPSDAIGSVANYLRKHGWRKGAPVVVLASTEGRKFRNFKSSYKRTHSLSKMQRNGIYPMGPIDQSVRLLRMSTYGGDEVWLAGHNFYVITRYNHSSKYALAVHQLAQAIKKRIKPVGARMARAN